MKKRKASAMRPSDAEIRLRSELDRTRRDNSRMKREAAEPVRSRPSEPDVPPTNGQPQALSDSTVAQPGELEGLRAQVEELSVTRQRLSKLYFSQVEENRKRAGKLHQILENICQINSHLDLDDLLQGLCETITTTLGFGVVLIRLREPGTSRLHACAFSGITPAARALLQSQDVKLEEFLSWLREDFKVGRSYFISHSHSFSRTLPSGYTPDLGTREEWEWHKDDVLLVPLFNRSGELVAYFSVDDPIDRLVPSSETMELLEIFGNHAVVAIENARLYRQLEQHTRELEEAGTRMQELHALKTNFVSTVSHELRTPLTAIKACVDTLLAAEDGDVPRDRRQHFLSIIRDENQRLARLIESVLDLNRFDSGAVKLVRQAVDMAELLEESERLLAPVAITGQVNLKVVTELADTRVDADRDQLRQLVLHLGSNAIKFTPAGGSVLLRLRGDSREVTLQVEDTGIGIPEQALEKIFERFYQVDSSLVRRYGGTGLGLAICKSIVEWHGGRVNAESTPGQGSRFTVVLPRRNGPPVVVRSLPHGETATEDLLRLAIEMVAEVMNARVVSLLTPEPDGLLRIQAAVGLDETVVRDTRIAPGFGVAGRVASERRPLCVARAGENGNEPASKRETYFSDTYLSVPLEGSQGLLGVLNVTDPEGGRPFEAEDCHLLLQVAARVAVAWQQAGRSTDGASEVAATLRQVVRHLERARRSAPDRVNLARALAREAGLDEAESALVSFAASIHDVGMNKLGESVIEGVGRLSDAERQAVLDHPEVGADLLEPLETLGAVQDVILAHHEWWDGTGYPRQLSGEAIPIGSRVLALVDAWESMVVGRAHKPARSRDEALGELMRLSGRQFDPALVQMFASALAASERHNASAVRGALPDKGTAGGRAMHDSGR